MNYFMIAAVFLPLCAARPWNQEGRGTSKDHDLQNCRECPAGYFMRNTFETPGGCTCTICPPGTFMEYPNNKSSCLRCKYCSQGFEEKTPCNGTHDRVCRCMAGTFQDRDNEICYKCKTCGGQEVVKKCTDIEDTVCSSTPIDEANTDKPNTTASLPDKNTAMGVGLVLGLVLGLGAITILVICVLWKFCKRKKKNSFEDKGEKVRNAEDHRQKLEMTEAMIKGKDLPKNWKDIVAENVDLLDVQILMRKLDLGDCKINEITNDYVHARDKKYELLSTWEKQIGNDPNILKNVMEGLYSCGQCKAADMLIGEARQIFIE
uniref:tumor necrosis factor receptor superfamily member 10B-like isoform X2 n=1 Tax=Myxine glutinosa TaxID=7769 RepID=UPI00358E2531